MLFVLVADLLQSILNESMSNELILAPISLGTCKDFPIIRYADDLVMHLSSAQLNQLKNLLMHFTTYTSLRVNYEKYVIVPIIIAKIK